MEEKKLVNKQPRDAHGHFIKLSKPQSEYVPSRKTTVPTTATESKKPQKSLWSTLRGALGILLVVLILSLFGIFGTSHVFCDKGVQTQVGVIRVLKAINPEQHSFKETFFQRFLHPEDPQIEQPSHRVILYTTVKTVIQVIAPDIPLDSFANKTVLATGQYNSCTQKLEVVSPQNIELAE